MGSQNWAKQLPGSQYLALKGRKPNRVFQRRLALQAPTTMPKIGMGNRYLQVLPNWPLGAQQMDNRRHKI